ncbi:MAG TPA: 23S rRNA (pseudouridine(1915)-N(3))-methyltransferase RlmH [Pseudomonadales bacterium]|nr:23S rRNA (pseudouridine(1915)-N(3))-methyltransferase RlmH [Pseudomonadales bacterium]
MKIRLLCVGTRVPEWVAEGYATFARRLPKDNALVLEQVPAARRQSDIRRCIDDEGERLLGRISHDECVIALDERGSAWSSVVLSQKLAAWRRDGRDVVLLVGGADGLSDKCMARAGESWSLSAATLPHALVRVVVAEQIYRAWTLLTGHPYHRE